MEIYRFLNRHRTLISKFVGVPILLVLIFTKTTLENDLFRLILDRTGLFLIVLGVFGRLWCSLYICGYKTQSLVRVGPYAMVRNPLYFFSFVGAVGISLATQNLILIFGITTLFFCYYPIVITYEEAKLKDRHGEQFTVYMQRTPRFIPHISKLTQPDAYEVNVRRYTRAFLDGIWFFIAYIFISFINYLHTHQVIPLVLEL